MEDLCERIERAALLRAARILAERVHPHASDAGTAFLRDLCAGDTALLYAVCPAEGGCDIGWLLDAAERIAMGTAPAAEPADDTPSVHLESVFNRFGRTDGRKEGFPVGCLTDDAALLSHSRSRNCTAQRRAAAHAMRPSRHILHGNPRCVCR